MLFWSDSYVSPCYLCHACFLPVLSSVVCQDYVAKELGVFLGLYVFTKATGVLAFRANSATLS